MHIDRTLLGYPLAPFLAAILAAFLGPALFRPNPIFFARADRTFA